MNCCLDVPERFDPIHLKQTVESCQQNKGFRSVAEGGGGECSGANGGLTAAIPSLWNTRVCAHVNTQRATKGKSQITPGKRM